MMKTEKLQSDETGYPGSIGASMALDAKETKEIRRILFHAKEPLHISAIGKLAGIDATNPAKQSRLSEFVSNYLANTSKEAEMCFEPTNKGRKFVGWKMNEHGKDMYSNGMS